MPRTLILLAVLAGAAPAVAQQTPVVRARIGDIEVVTALGEEIAREAAGRLARFRDELRRAGLPLRRADLPVRAAVLGSVFDLAPLTDAAGLGSARTRALSLVGADANYIVVAWHAAGSPLIALEHELTHLAEPFPDAPAWLREGRADYFARRGRADAGHLHRLRAGEWLSLDQMRRAEPHSTSFGAWTFYPQAWLTLHWLAGRGADPARMDASALNDAVRELGIDGVEAALRKHAEALDAASATEDILIEAVLLEGVAVESASPWASDLLLAAFDRERGETGRAAERLRSPAAEHPNDAAIAAELGALEMDLGHYDAAEPWLAQGAAHPDAGARTHYRYALMLLRPTSSDAVERAREAARHAREALSERPGSSAYRLTLAQAEMVSQRWAESERALEKLRADPVYAHRARAELRTLRLRRVQASAADPAPPVSTEAPVAAAELGVRLPSPLPLPQPVEPDPAAWPPPGAHIALGRIDTVDCSGPEKVVILKNRLFPMRFREPAGRPARLHQPPDQWKALPCNGAAGRYVNLAYKPAAKPGRIRGDVVAILF